MDVRITLGTKFLPEPIHIRVAIPAYAAEAGPDFYFESLNRVGVLEEWGGHATANQHRQADAERIMHRYPGELGQHGAWLRNILDHHEAPSMSTGDTITIFDDEGNARVTYRCDPVGWTTIVPAPTV